MAAAEIAGDGEVAGMLSELTVAVVVAAFDRGRLAGPVDRHEQALFARGGLHLGDVALYSRNLFGRRYNMLAVRLDAAGWNTLYVESPRTGGVWITAIRRRMIVDMPVFHGETLPPGRLPTDDERVERGSGHRFGIHDFADVKGTTTIARDEPFGPVLAVTRFGDEDEAVRIANDADYGLASHVWSRDAKTPHRAARHIRAGTVWGNTASAIDRSVPVGGLRQSARRRQNGPHGIEHFPETKSIVAAL